MFISFALIQVKRTREKIKANTKFAEIPRKNAKNKIKAGFLFFITNNR